MYEHEALYEHLRQLITGAQILHIPIIWLEQNPEKMGATVDPVKELLTDHEPIAKMCFSCAKSPEFMKRLESLGRNTVILAGIETHVCVYQTAADLTSAGYNVQVVQEADSSRTAANRLLGLDRIRAVGGSVTGIEMLLFEMLGTAEHPKFKDILRLVK
jgi:isochorismate hydrolase